MEKLYVSFFANSKNLKKTFLTKIFKRSQDWNKESYWDNSNGNKIVMTSKCRIKNKHNEETFFLPTQLPIKTNQIYEEGEKGQNKE